MKKHSRRDFIKVVGLSGSGLMLASFVPSYIFALKLQDEPKIFEPSVYLRIDSKGIVTITIHRTEMGQGVMTSLPMLVAEELEVDIKNIRVELADADRKYGNQSTGGSQSIRRNFDPLRKAGAAAREMLITAAALVWKVKPSDCHAENGFVINNLTKEKINYGELVDDASKLPVPTNVKLKDPKDYKIIGKRIPRFDMESKVTGKAKFGIDVVVPNMFYAAIAHCPTFGGIVKSFNDSKARAVNGVVDVVQVSQGIAVIAKSTWQALKGKEALEIQWDLGKYADVDNESIRNEMLKHIASDGTEMQLAGNINQLFDGEKFVDAIYEVPFLAHAPMEPMNSVASFKNGKVELWCPSQNPQSGLSDVAKALGIKEEDVTLHVTLVGGGFGRRLINDYAVEAAEIAKASGKTVKLTWTREDDMRFGAYRPPSMHVLKGSVSESSIPLKFSHHVIAPSITAQRFNPNVLVKDSGLGEGSMNLPYLIPNIKISGTIVSTHIPLLWWRSVYNSQNPFAAESFIDELAFAAKKDPFEFRRDLLPKDSRLRNVLEIAAEKSNWNKKLSIGDGKGVACFQGYGSFCAQVFEVSSDSKSYKINKITAVIDCGTVVNPFIVESQLEGAIIFALSAAMKGEITIRNGGVIDKNYDSFQIMTYSETPKFDLHVVQNFLPVGGVGEVGIGAAAPALCNALFSATGKRIRRLPIKF
jgi:isoquinoline 1-oxidoreductase beta subunit